MRLLSRFVRTPTDVERMRQLYNENVPWLRTHDGIREVTPQEQEAWWTSQRDTHAWLFSEVGNPTEDIAFVTLRDRDGFRTPMFGIAERARGRGYAQDLIDYYLEYSCGPLAGSWRADHAAIDKLNLRNGWVRVGERDGVVLGYHRGRKRPPQDPATRMKCYRVIRHYHGLTEPTITVLLPTIGRTVLRRAIESVVPQLMDGDEVIVLADGPRPVAEEIMKEFVSPQVHYIERPFTGVYGANPMLDYGNSIAIGEFIVAYSDDDYLTERALKVIRDAVRGKALHPHIFAMKHSGYILSHSASGSQVSGQQLVVPNVPEQFAEWDEDRSSTSDHAYIMNTIRNWDDEVEFHSGLICILEACNGGKIF